MTTTTGSFNRPPRSHLAETLQFTMVTTLIIGVVGFLIAAWAPAGPSNVRAERAAAAAQARS
jgi:hypothetical protein